MGAILSHVRAFGAPGLCTVALFAIAAWLPNDVVDFVAWLLAVFLGLPVSILAKVHANRSATPTGRLTPATLTFALRALGATSVLFGVGVLGWLAYHGIVRPVPEVAGFTALAQALLLMALIGFGHRVLSRPLHAKRTDHDAATPAHED